MSFTDVNRMRRHIFAACRELGLDDDVRRDIQMEATGKASSKDMNAADMQLMLVALKAKGWKPTSGAKGRKGKDWIDVKRADLKKIIAIWGQIAGAGHAEPGRAAINAFITNTNFHTKWGDVATDVAMIGPERARDVIEALKDLARRHQVRLRK